MMRSVRRTLVILWMLAVGAFGQSTFSSLVGTVTDNSGGLIPNAEVVATEVTTNVSKKALTNSQGDFQLVNLVPGTYELTISAAGFQKFVQHQIPLDPRSTVRVDASLKVGTTQTVVEIKATPPVITTETGTVTDQEKYRQVSELPYNYRAVELHS
jgi:hypothetical protein